MRIRSNLPELLPRGLAAGVFSRIPILRFSTRDGMAKPRQWLGGLLQLDAIGTWTRGPIRVGIGAPLILRSFGGTASDVTAIGDMSLEGKWRAVDPSSAPVGVALALRTALPTGTGGGSLAGGGFGMDAMVAVDTVVAENLSLAINAGIAGRPGVAMEDVQWGTAVMFQAGAAYRFTEQFGLNTEFTMSGVLADLSNALARPAELLVGGVGRVPGSPLVVRPGVVVGLTDAVTTPRSRFLLSVAWAPTAEPVLDADGDGILDADDTCVTEAEDLDGFEDEDGCAEIASITVRVIDTDGFPLPEAKWLTGTHEGVSGTTVDLSAGEHLVEALGASVAVNVPGGGSQEVVIEVPAPRGSLEVRALDADGDPVAGAQWVALGEKEFAGESNAVLRVRPGSYALEVTAEGYRPVDTEIQVTEGDDVEVVTLTLIPAKAQLSAEKIDIKDSVYFETNKAVIRVISYDLLDEVADILKRHPEITMLRIEGHTDSQQCSDTLCPNRCQA